MAISPSGAASNQHVTQEKLLFDYVQRLAPHRTGRIALHVHLSRLQSYNRRDHHMRIAITTFESLVGLFEGQMFVLKNKDIVFIGPNRAAEKLDEAVVKLRYLFSDDPLIMQREATMAGRAANAFTTWYVLDREYDQMLDDVTKISQLMDTGAPANMGGGDKFMPEKSPITPDRLGWLEDSLKMADVSNMVRNQPVCAISRGQLPVPVFHELYVSIADLEESVTPGVDLASNRWLFQYLTTTLDKRMLIHLAREGEKSSRAFSFNMNVATLLSSEFQKFDSQVSSSLRGRLVIELQKIDIFADMSAYLFARDYVMDRGYRVCLDGLSHFTAPYIDYRRLGFDFAKIYWTPSMAAVDLPRLAQDLRGSDDGDMARVILCRCDDEMAIETGKKLGINLFQGRHVDSLLRTPSFGSPLRAS